MMKIGDTVICAYAGQTDKLKTHATYEVLNVIDYEGKGSHVSVYDLEAGEAVQGDYSVKRFMLKGDMINQVLENAKHG